MSRSWRLARSLETLRSEIETAYPGTTIWDIGDEAHQGGDSDHNPTDAGVVCAVDVLADGGLDLAAFAEHLKEHPTRAVKYVIYNRRIWSKARNGEGWRNYHGKNPHTTHVHVSVGVGPDGHSTGPYDDTSPWGIADLGDAAPSHPAAPKGSGTDWLEEAIMSMPTLRRGAKGTDVKRAQGLLHANGYNSSKIDGDFGPRTERDVENFQEKHDTRNSVRSGKGDGIVGRYTWTDLLGA